MKIKMVYADIYEQIFNGFIVEDEKGKTYKMSPGIVWNMLIGKEIVKTHKARTWEHIEKIN